MSKIHSLKVWLVSILLATLGLIAISININIPFNNNTLAFNNFANQVTALLGEYNTSPQSLYFDINNDVLLSDNQYYIPIDKYQVVTGDSVLLEDDSITISHKELSIKIFDDTYLYNEGGVTMQSAPLTKDNYISLDTITNNLGYECQITDESINLYRPFASARLIVTSNNTLTDTFGAVAVVSGYKNLHILQYSTEQDAINAYENYLQDTTIISVEPDAIMRAEEVDTIATTNDVHYTWGASSIGVDEYSEYLVDTVGTNNLDDVVVAVLDTGIDTDHAFFANRIVGGANFTNNTSTTSYAYEDNHGHGTHVSGIICDLTLDNVKVMPVKVLNSQGYGYTSSIMLGLEYVLQQKQAGVNICAINLSLGGEYPSNGTEGTKYQQYITDAYNKGIFSVVSSGNDGKDIKTYLPSNIPNAITVSAVGKSNNTYYCPTWSNYGENVDISAPGTNILSAQMGGGTVSMSGTSMSAPHVSACIALIRCNSTQKYTMQQLQDLLEFYATDLGTEGFDIYYGYGMINIGSIYADMLESLTFSNGTTKFTNTNNTFTQAFNLNITCSDANAQIYYTFGNTKPTNTTGTLYTGPINITESTRVNAAAYVISEGQMKKCSQAKTFNFYYYGIDVEENFTVNSDGQLISYNGDFSEITIPSTVGGITITSIGKEVFYGNTKITEVHLPDTITYLDRYCFAGCTKLTTIYAPKVVEIDIGAFSRCIAFNSLSDFYFPELLEIGKYAFEKCYSLTSANLKNVYYVDDYAFYTNTSLRTVDMPSLQSVGMSGFEGCTQLSTVNIPNVNTICSSAFANTYFYTIALDNVVAIGNSVFKNNTNLTTLILDKLQYVGIESFYNCDGLENLNCPELFRVAKYAFYDCDNIVSIFMPNLNDLGTGAFISCDKLQTANLPNLERISPGAFNNCINLQNVTLNSIIDIQNSAFYNCISLDSVTLSPNLLNIQDNAFDNVNPNCVFNIYGYTMALDFVTNKSFAYTNLAMAESYFLYTINGDEVTITGYSGTLPNNTVIPAMIQGKYVTHIADNAFKDCLQITEVNLTYLKTIGDNAFSGCTNLVRVNTTNLVSIGSSAFEGCTSLEDVYFPDVVTIQDYALYKCGALLSVTLGQSITSIGEYAIGYDYIDNEKVVIPVFTLYGYSDTISQQYATDNDITFEPIFNALRSYYYTLVNNGTEIHISWVNKYISGCLNLPSEYNGLPITGIASEAFYNCTFISAIHLPDSITYIGNSAFANCSMLSYINLDKVTYIGNSAFENCCSLTSVNVSSITTISAYAFAECDNLNEVYADKVTTIGQSAFYSCISLTSVNCPKLTTIYGQAFDSCYKLSSINTKLLQVIEDWCFDDCSSLTTMYLPKIVNIGYKAFSNTGLTKLVVGKGILSANLSGTQSLVVYGYNNTIISSHCRQLGIQFVPISDVVITKDLLPQMELYVGNPFNQISVSNTGFEAKYQWYISYDGLYSNVQAIPCYTDTLSIDNTGLMPATYYFVKITNWDDSSTYSTVASVSVKNAPFTFNGGKLTNATYGTSYSANIIETTGGDEFTYSLISGAPNGITLSGNTLIGTPTTAGEFVLVISATLTNTGQTMYAYFDLTVSPKDIIVTINSASSVYGESLTKLTYTLDNNEIFGDDELGIILQKENGRNVGTYIISGSANNTNYNVTFTNATYTITPRPITIHLLDQTKQYGNEITIDNTAYVVTSSFTQSIVYGDILAVTIQKEVGDNVGEYNLTAVCGNPNYLATIQGATYTITKGVLDDIVTVSDCITPFDGEYHWINVEFTKEINPTIRYKLSSILSNYDILQPIQESRYRDYIGMDIPIFVEITSQNYQTYTASAILRIEQAKLAISLVDKTKVYGSADADLEYNITSGVILESDINKLVVYREGGNNVGEYTINASISSSNYELIVKTATYSIMPVNIGIDIADKSSDYGATMQPLEYNITSGTVYMQDDLEVVLSTEATNQSIPAEYIISGSWNNPNYLVTFTNGTYTITTPQNALLDTTTGVIMYLGSQYQDTMSIVVDSEVLEDKTTYNNAKDNGFDIKRIYNITILNDGVEVTLTSPVVIKLAYNSEMMTMRGVALCDCSNFEEMVEINSSVVDGFLCFTVSDTTDIALYSPCATTQQIGSIIIALGILIALLVISVVYTIYKNTRLKQRKSSTTSCNIKYRK